jgi:hypothetical protein
VKPFPFGQGTFYLEVKKMYSGVEEKDALCEQLSLHSIAALLLITLVCLFLCVEKNI